jgi:hypothetical protein
MLQETNWIYIIYSNTYPINRECGFGLKINTNNSTL